MRIHLALSAGKRVAFADTTGGDLVDVKEFVAFESDDEEESARWEEEEAKYRKPEREPIYVVQPEFHAPDGDALLQAVRANKLELSFAPPYTTHGSRIEFVVRYETADGDFWANNSSVNYVVTLLLTYEDDSAQTSDTEQLRGILRPPKVYSMPDDLESDEEQEKEEGTSTSGLIRPTPICPVIVQPEIDVEIAVPPSGPSVPPNHELPSADGTLSAHTVSPGERLPCTSSETTLQTNASFVLCASESVQPNKSQPLPRLHYELGNQTSEQPTDSGPSAPLPSLQQASKLRSDSSQADGEEIPPSEASCMHPPTTETNLQPTGEDRSTENTASRPCLELELELPAACVSAPTVTQAFEQEVAEEASELVTESSSTSAAHCESGPPVLLSPATESQEREIEAPAPAPVPAPELTEITSVSADVSKASQNSALQSDPACEETEDAPQISPDALLEDLSNTLSEAPELRSEHDVNRNLMPSIIFLSGVVSLSIVMQEPSALFLMGLLMVLHRL
ncbi:hypothetical protein INR49_011648 [Caranx melampygus]|nr:hypothetical protein INR49_011648 [Caranx melampygus]